MPGERDDLLRGLRRAGDNIVDIHATSRGRPGLQDARIDLSLSEGLIYERNTAKRLMEEIRKARPPSLSTLCHPDTAAGPNDGIWGVYIVSSSCSSTAVLHILTSEGPIGVGGTECACCLSDGGA